MPRPKPRVTQTSVFPKRPASSQTDDNVPPFSHAISPPPPPSNPSPRRARSAPVVSCPFLNRSPRACPLRWVRLTDDLRLLQAPWLLDRIDLFFLPHRRPKLLLDSKRDGEECKKKIPLAFNDGHREKEREPVILSRGFRVRKLVVFEQAPMLDT